MQQQIAFKDIRSNFSEVASKVQYANARYILTKNNHPALALISIHDLEILERCIEALEDKQDVEAYEARKNEKTVLLEKVWEELGID